MTWPQAETDEAWWACPVYVIAEAANPEVPEGWAEAIAAGMQTVCDRLLADPVIADWVYLASAIHGASIWMQRSLSRPVDQIPIGTPDPALAISYDALFRNLINLVTSDETRLRNRGLRVDRPVVVLIMATPPAASDQWMERFEDSSSLRAQTDWPRSIGLWFFRSW